MRASFWLKGEGVLGSFMGAGRLQPGHINTHGVGVGGGEWSGITEGGRTQSPEWGSLEGAGRGWLLTPQP